MNLNDKPRHEWSDADIQANLMADMLMRRAGRLQEVIDRFEQTATRLRHVNGETRQPQPATAAMVDLASFLSWQIANMNLQDLFRDAADVDARYAAERQAASITAAEALLAERAARKVEGK